jgi:hypothetical protein
MPGRLDAQSLDLARRWRNSVDLENEDIDPSWWEDVLSAAILDAYEAPELMSSHLQRAALADGVGEASVKNQAMASPCSHEGFLSAVLDRADELITGTRRRLPRSMQRHAASSYSLELSRWPAICSTMQARRLARSYGRPTPRTVVVDPYAHLSGPLTTLGLRVASG